MTSTGRALDESERALFADFADQLIPSDGTMPLPSELGIQNEGLDRLQLVVPASFDAVVEALRFALGRRIETVDDLRSADVAAFSSIGRGVAGIYLTESAVQRAYGYPGPKRLDVGDPFTREGEYWPLTEEVRARGFVWRGEPAN